MFGSSPQHRFLEGRRIVLELDLTMPALDAVLALGNFMAEYQGDKDALRFGYWDSGEALVVAAPETEMVICPVHQTECEWCYGTARVTREFGARLEKAKAAGQVF